MDQLILMSLVFLIGAASGAMGYRWFGKKDSAKLEEMAAQLKEFGKKL